MAWTKVALVTGMVPCHPNQQVQCLSCTKILNAPSLMTHVAPWRLSCGECQESIFGLSWEKSSSVEDLKGLKGVSPYQNSAAIKENRLRDLEGRQGWSDQRLLRRTFNVRSNNRIDLEGGVGWILLNLINSSYPILDQDGCRCWFLFPQPDVPTLRFSTIARHL